LGLHFNLTDLEVRRSPRSLISDWFFGGRKAKQFVFSEFDRQIEAFEKLGLKPQHLDGHEHLHLLPGFLNQVAPICRSVGIQTVRIPLDWSLVKRVQAPILPLSLLARRSAEEQGFEVLPFAYPSGSRFKNSTTLAAYLRRHYANIDRQLL
jgi:predicted glycoside hydrolase/deacetylase ChbG (UPF0249 family)